MTTQLELYNTFTPYVTIYVSYDLTSWEIFENKILDKAEILAYIILHTDGQIIDGANEFEPLPGEAYFIEERKIIDRSNLPKFKDIKLNTDHIEITHTSSPFSSHDSSLYTTRITNKGSSTIKINRFSTYSKQLWNKLRTRPTHSNIINGWFNSSDFRMWYGQKSESIKPNESVSDLRNYGANCFWIYEVQTDEGQVFWVSSFKE